MPSASSYRCRNPAPALGGELEPPRGLARRGDRHLRVVDRVEEHGRQVAQVRQHAVGELVSSAHPGQAAGERRKRGEPVRVPRPYPPPAEGTRRSARQVDALRIDAPGPQGGVGDVDHELGAGGIGPRLALEPPRHDHGPVLASGGEELCRAGTGRLLRREPPPSVQVDHDALRAIGLAADEVDASVGELVQPPILLELLPAPGLVEDALAPGPRLRGLQGFELIESLEDRRAPLRVPAGGDQLHVLGDQVLALALGRGLRLLGDEQRGAEQGSQSQHGYMLAPAAVQHVRSASDPEREVERVGEPHRA